MSGRTRRLSGARSREPSHITGSTVNQTWGWSSTSRPGWTEKRTVEVVVGWPALVVSMRYVAQVPGFGSFSANTCHWARAGTAPTASRSRAARWRMSPLLGV